MKTTIYTESRVQDLYNSTINILYTIALGTTAVLFASVLYVIFK